SFACGRWAHSINSSAATSRTLDITRLSALAVLRLMTRSIWLVAIRATRPASRQQEPCQCRYRPAEIRWRHWFRNSSDHQHRRTPAAGRSREECNEPGGNVTGVTFLASDLGSKRLGLLREFVANATAIAMLMNPNYHPTVAEVREVRV